ncbi:MAG: saccharopine dehydrogenase [Solirubrobacterales bacterium]|nr:saccharopine dehydrogenase [Solirubrobacterales bacterium]
MSSPHPVVIYGASGYTGRLIAEYLREYHVPFVAAGRDAEKLQAIMDKVPGIETATYEVRAVEHTVEALTELFAGAKVVCNTVGPFATYGMTVAEAALVAGAHYIDTTGEQNWMIDVRDKLGEAYAEQGLLLAPCIAQMYTSGEIAANIALEDPSVDTLDTLVLWAGAPTIASTDSIFTILMADHFYLENDALVQWPGAVTFEAAVPGQHPTSLVLPWGGTSHPVWFQDDPRVVTCKSYGGVFNREVMTGVAQIAQMVEEQIKPMESAEEQQAALGAIMAQMDTQTPPRENPRVNRSLDSVVGSGPLGSTQVVIRGACNYQQTGLLQAYCAHALLQQPPRRAGFASGCQAFGHRELLGVLQRFGLVGEPTVTRV